MPYIQFSPKLRCHINCKQLVCFNSCISFLHIQHSRFSNVSHWPHFENFNSFPVSSILHSYGTWLSQSAQNATFCTLYICTLLRTECKVKLYWILPSFTKNMRSIFLKEHCFKCWSSCARNLAQMKPVWIYQEITNRCHVTVLYFLLILYMFRTHSVSIIRRSIKLTSYATSGTVTVSCGRPSSWLSQDDYLKQMG
jgi:hypothetical protein